MVHPIGKRFFKLIIYPYIRKITGEENLDEIVKNPKKGFIIAVNHESYMDHLMISTYFINRLNRRIHFLAKKEHFDTWFKNRFHRWADAIPIDRQAGGKEALKWATLALSQGSIISIHPEGTRTLTGKIQRGKTGFIRLALNAKVPILPVGLVGTFHILPKGKTIPKFKRAEMHIGKLIYLDKYYGKEDDSESLRVLTDKIMKDIARLAKQEYNFDEIGIKDDKVDE